MRQFTKTEIGLCEKIAEKERTENEYGDYYFHEITESVGLVDRENRLYLYTGDDYTPLWQEHDCLDWLKKKGFDSFIIMQLAGGYSCDGYIGKEPYLCEGKTVLEALLLVVLAVIDSNKMPKKRY